MKQLNQKKAYYVFLILFFLTNILNTYFLTVQELNRYIAPFKHTLKGEINAFLGNLSILSFIVILILVIFRSAKGRMKALIYTSLFLNFCIFFLGIFNLYFGTAFSMPARVIFYNPAGGFALSTLFEVLLELVIYYRIIVFFPVIILTVFFILLDRKKLKLIKFGLNIKQVTTVLLFSLITVYTANMTYTRMLYEDLPLNSVKSTYAVQNFGVYPFYFGEVLGLSHEIDLIHLLDVESESDLAYAFDEYNKNKNAYYSFFTNQAYTNRLTLSQTVDNLTIDSSLLVNDNLHGILKGKNLVMVQIESLNHFLLDIPEINNQFTFLNKLFKESFVMNNFYNNVGMGVSSDGEFTALTGLYPKGEETIYWEYNNTPYELNSLVKYFNKQNYDTIAIHGDHKTFYNRDVVYENLMGFDSFYSLENFILDGYDLNYVYDTSNNLVHTSPWVSDYYLPLKVNEIANNTQNPFMLFPITMMPHTPFDFGPYKDSKDIYSTDLIKNINNLTLKYINYASYYDQTLERFFFDEYGNNHTLDNTVYLFYSDHGSGIKNGDLNLLYGENMPITQVRKILQQCVSFLYVPGDELNEDGLYKGLIKGEQNLVRSQVDIFRTVIELFDLDYKDSYYGVHLMSSEKTFALDNRLMDVVLDDYFYSMRNYKNTFPLNYLVPKRDFNYILRFKQLSDLLLSEKDYQARIDNAIRKYVYGEG